MESESTSLFLGQFLHAPSSHMRGGPRNGTHVWGPPLMLEEGALLLKHLCFFPLFGSFFQSFLLFLGVVEFLNSASLSIFFTILSTHMIKCMLINQLTKHWRFRYERGIKCYQVWGLWTVLIVAVDWWWPMASGVMHQSAFAYATLLFCCSVVAQLLSSKVFCRKVGFFFFFFGQWLRNSLLFPLCYMCIAISWLRNCLIVRISFEFY